MLTDYDYEPLAQLRSPQLYKQMAMSADMPGAFEAHLCGLTDFSLTCRFSAVARLDQFFALRTPTRHGICVSSQAGRAEDTWSAHQSKSHDNVSFIDCYYSFRCVLDSFGMFSIFSVASHGWSKQRSREKSKGYQKDVTAKF